MRDLTIRPKENDDEARCAEIMTQAMRLAFPWVQIAEMDVFAFREVTADEHVLVAEDGGRVLGLAGIYQPGAFLHHLYVDPASHGRGIGRALLAEAVRPAGPCLSLKCQVRNDGARRFYRACGWVEEQPSGERNELGEWLWIRAPR